MDNNTSAKRSRFEHIPGLLDPGCSPHIECNTYVDKDKEINKYRQRCFKFDNFCQKLNKDILEYQKKVSELKEKNVRQEEDFEKKRKAFDCYKNTIEDKIRILENSRTALDSQLKQQKQKVEELTKDLNNKSEQIKQLNESKSLVNNNNDMINKLKSEKAELNNQLLLKETTHSNEIQILDKDLKKRSEKITKYKNLYEKTVLDNAKDRTTFEQTLDENKKLKEEIKKMKSESTKLKQQRTYFENHNENNKRRYLGVSHSAIKQRTAYRNGFKDNCKKQFGIHAKLFSDFREFLKIKEKESKNNILESSAKTCREIGKELQKVRESEKRILEKRPDGRILCGSCDQTFATAGQLTHHMTVTHRMATNPEQRDQNIDEEEDDIICLD